ncbi:hypothetical protein CYMTET_41917 [Cymbomonas tetramitiformis]|uniref:Ankyrin repeat protein n=1 Tax=Cymbomonas tetramitiformis TaxID=36881 RepID=A0AAE0C548_9CHLO|nr:hypothetical protein CYMTET_41917 [Cymbomonas tetramitiformis]
MGSAREKPESVKDRNCSIFQFFGFGFFGETSLDSSEDKGTLEKGPYVQRAYQNRSLLSNIEFRKAKEIFDCIGKSKSKSNELVNTILRDPVTPLNHEGPVERANIKNIITFGIGSAGETLLFMAVKGDDWKIVQELFKRNPRAGLDYHGGYYSMIDLADAEGTTALMWAVETSNSDAVEQLTVFFDANPNLRNPSTNKSAKDIAADQITIAKETAHRMDTNVLQNIIEIKEWLDLTQDRMKVLYFNRKRDPKQNQALAYKFGSKTLITGKA